MLPIPFQQPKNIQLFSNSQINFHEITDQEQLKVYENSTLQENNLIRLDIPQVNSEKIHSFLK